MVIVAQLGARMHYAVPAILQRAGLLERLYTDIYAPRLPKPFGALTARYGPPSLRRWLGRSPVDIPEEKITSFDAMGLEYIWRRRRAASLEAGSAACLWAGQEFCRRIIHCGLGGASSVYTYNSAGLELLQHARAQGVNSITEQTFAPEKVHQEILSQERADYAGWSAASAENPLTPAYEEREQMEWDAADLILCGSEFVREGIRTAGGPADRCRVVPYGVRPPVRTSPRDSRHRPLRVLTVGAVGLRKGAPYVLGAAKLLTGKAEFRMAGELEVSASAQQLLREHVTLLGVVPRSEIQEQFAWADIFLLPSLCEGSATATYEALSQGLPVITTPNAGSVVRDGVDGFIVPIRDVAAIVDRIERLADDADLWTKMSTNAMTRSEEYTLEKYGDRLLDALQMVSPTASQDLLTLGASHRHGSAQGASDGDLKS